jgi:hypothetical protein
MRDYDFDESEAPDIDAESITDAELDAATDLLRTTEERDAACSSSFPAGGKIADGGEDDRDDKLTAFYGVLFAPDNWVLTRPTETWIENGKKQSKVDYKGTKYNKASAIVAAMDFHRKRAETTNCNLFVSAAPRFGPKGGFDKAWQIRELRVVWQDLDHCSAVEALERCKAAGLPEPTIVVVSGAGVHLYWAIDPYVIDDGDPRPVLTEWPDKPDPETGKKKPRQYILAPDGERLYQDIPANRSDL